MNNHPMTNRICAHTDTTHFPLSRAVLCPACNSVSQVTHDVCPACASRGLLNLSVILNRPIPAKEDTHAAAIHAQSASR
jgi:DnaJ-class molecular chaperone